MHPFVIARNGTIMKKLQHQPFSSVRGLFFKEGGATSSGILRAMFLIWFALFLTSNSSKLNNELRGHTNTAVHHQDKLYLHTSHLLQQVQEKHSPPTTMKPFCQDWDKSTANNRTLQPFDIWFTHHPTWVIFNETDESLCVKPGNIRDHPYIRGLNKFYTNQFHSLCDRVHIRTMWSSGWGADFSNLRSGLLIASKNGIPLITQDCGQPWHYTANKNDSSALVCEEGDTTCYFLPYHDCKTSSAKYWDEQNKTGKVELVVDNSLLSESNMDNKLGRDAYRFMTRKQLWLQRAVFDYKQAFKAANNITSNSDCTVVHVRRADVVLHAGSTRKYFPVSDYVKQLNKTKLANPHHYIFLLTDDSNAIDEAHEFFPELNWKYLDRPRHKGSSGGWENQTPSRNPALEVIILLATFELAQECSAIVWGASGFADLLLNQMHMANPMNKVDSYRVERNLSVYNDTYNASESELEKHLEALRNKTKDK